jgi:hypothetical protein
MGDLYGLAVALRTDRADVASYASVLTDALGSALPAGMVEVERDRSMKDRLAGRGVAAQVRRIVRGVVISRQDVSLEEWVQALAAELAGVAARDAAAADALHRLLDP